MRNKELLAMLGLSLAVVMNANAETAFTVQNAGTVPKEGAAVIQLSDIGLPADSKAVKATVDGNEIPSQIDGGSLAVLAQVDAGKTIRIKVEPAGATTNKLDDTLLKVDRSDPNWINIDNGIFKLRYEKRSGAIYDLNFAGETFKGYNGALFPVSVIPCGPHGETSDLRSLGRWATPAEVQVIAAGPVRTVLCARYKMGPANIEEQVSVYPKCPVIHFDIKAKLEGKTVNISHGGGFVLGNDKGGLYDGIRFYPDEKRVATPDDWEEQEHYAWRYRFAYNPAAKIGIGLLVPRDNDFVSLMSSVKGPGDYIDSVSNKVNTFQYWDLTLKCQSPILYNLPERKDYNFKADWIFCREAGDFEKLVREAEISLTAMSEGKGENKTVQAPGVFDGCPAVEIRQLFPVKAIFDTKTKASARVLLLNNSDLPKNVEIIGTLENHIGTMRDVKGPRVTLQPREKKEVMLEWDSGKEEYGFSLTVKAIEGGTLLDQRREFFSVARQWAKVLQMTYAGTASPDPRYAVKTEYQDYTELRRQYWNSTMIWGHWYDNAGNMVWDTADVHPGLWGVKEVSQVPVKLSIAAVKRAGIKPIFYWWMAQEPFGLPIEISQRDPRRTLFDPTGKAISTPNYAHPDYLPWWSKQFVLACKKFGFEGSYWDSGENILHNEKIWHLRTYDGGMPWKPFGATPEEANANWHKKIIGEVRKEIPEFMHFPQCEPTCKDTLAFADMGLTEPGNNYVATWKGQMEYNLNAHKAFEMNRTETAQLSIVPRMPEGQARDDPMERAWSALNFACRFHIWGFYTMQGGFDTLRFATRYSEYLYDGKQKWIEDPEKTMGFAFAPPNERVLARDFVYERPLPSHRKELLIHMLQLPPAEFVWRSYAPCETLKNLNIGFAVPSGTKVKGAWVLSPDLPTKDHMRQKAEFKTEGDKVVVTVSTLTYYNLVVVQLGE